MCLCAFYVFFGCKLGLDCLSMALHSVMSEHCVNLFNGFICSDNRHRNDNVAE